MHNSPIYFPREGIISLSHADGIVLLEYLSPLRDVCQESRIKIPSHPITSHHEIRGRPDILGHISFQNQTSELSRPFWSSSLVTPPHHVWVAGQPKRVSAKKSSCWSGPKKIHKFFGWGPREFLSTPIETPLLFVRLSSLAQSLFFPILFQSSFSTPNNSCPPFPSQTYFKMADEVYDGAIGIDLGTYTYPCHWPN